MGLSCCLLRGAKLENLKNRGGPWGVLFGRIFGGVRWSLGYCCYRLGDLFGYSFVFKAVIQANENFGLVLFESGLARSLRHLG